MFENKMIKGIHISRYVASWCKVGGGKIYPADLSLDPSFKLSKCKTFAGWLQTLVIDGERLTRDEIVQICNYATNGKLELQESAKNYLSTP